MGNINPVLAGHSVYRDSAGLGGAAFREITSASNAGESDEANTKKNKSTFHEYLRMNQGMNWNEDGVARQRGNRNKPKREKHERMCHQR